MPECTSVSIILFFLELLIFFVGFVLAVPAFAGGLCQHSFHSGLEVVGTEQGEHGGQQVRGIAGLFHQRVGADDARFRAVPGVGLDHHWTGGAEVRGPARPPGQGFGVADQEGRLSALGQEFPSLVTVAGLERAYTKNLQLDRKSVV